MTRSSTSRVALVAALLTACAGAPHDAAEPVAGNTGLHATRWSWVEARCIDGRLPIAELGFERELHVEMHGDGLQLTYDDALAARGCVRSSVWIASPAGAGRWRLDPQAVVTLPPDANCGAVSEAPLRALLRAAGPSLEVVEEASPWCRGLDARFVYRRGERTQLDAEQIARRWAAHFNRRDADALARLFAEGGSLVEPFTPTDDGGNRRHEGRAAVRAWLRSAFATTPWLALRVLEIEPLDAPGAIAARWQYMDPSLAQPFAGRNLFAVAGGEIYEAEIQLLESPLPRETTPSVEASP